ncbi:MAG TPA: hypothetical protein VN699_12930 [Pirellulales bacterium]|nr:hypothetical protein [Pirellulales bacterium]
MKRAICFLMLSLASFSGCAAAPNSLAPSPPAAANGVERFPPIHSPPPPMAPQVAAKKKGFWECLWPWDDERDARPKTQREIDDDFKWRNNG